MKGAPLTVTKNNIADGIAQAVICNSGNANTCNENGKEYIDLSSGIAVNTFGIADGEWIAAVTEQASKIQHASNLYYTEPSANLAKILCSRTGAEKVFFSNSGAEANECAIKCARLWAEKNKGSDYYNIITLKNSFHGRTVTTLAATGQEVFHEHFTPMTEGFLYAEANNLDEVIKLARDNKCAAVMMEPIQGEGGVMTLDERFVQGVCEFAKENGLLVILDEVQTGNGRSGYLYTYEHFRIKPDILTTAKGLAGGLPIGATLFFDKTADVLSAGLHGSTFGGNPVSCAAAISVINRIDEKLLKEVREKSEYIFSELEGADGIKSVSGLGLMIGIETVGDASKIIQKCMEEGILPIKAKNKVRLLPALNIPMPLLEKAVKIIKKAAKETT